MRMLLSVATFSKNWNYLRVLSVVELVVDAANIVLVLSLPLVATPRFNLLINAGLCWN